MKKMKTLFELLDEFYKCTSVTERMDYINKTMVNYSEKPTIVKAFKQLKYAQLNPLV